MDVTPNAIRDGLHEHLRSLFEAPDLATARTLLRQITNTFTERTPKAVAVVAVLEAGFDDATTVLALPDLYRRRLRTTNSVERLNEETCRRRSPPVLMRSATSTTFANWPLSKSSISSPTPKISKRCRWRCGPRPSRRGRRGSLVSPLPSALPSLPERPFSSRL